MSTTTTRAGLVTGIATLAVVAVIAIAQPSTASPVPAAAGQGVPQNFSVASPTRVLDTRTTGVRVAAGETITVNSGLVGFDAVGVNLTLTDTLGFGFLTAWAGGPRPNTSVINSDRAGQSIANYVVVPTNANGTFQLYTFGAAHIIVDVMGAYTGTGATIVPTTTTPASSPSTSAPSATSTSSTSSSVAITTG